MDLARVKPAWWYSKPMKISPKPQFMVSHSAAMLHSLRRRSSGTIPPLFSVA